MKDKERLVLELVAKGVSYESAYDEAKYGKAQTSQAKCNIIRKLKERHAKHLSKMKDAKEKVSEVRVAIAFDDAKQVIETILLSAGKDSDRIAAFRELCRVNGWGENETINLNHLSLKDVVSGLGDQDVL